MVHRQRKIRVKSETIRQLGSLELSLVVAGGDTGGAQCPMADTGDAQCPGTR